MYLKMYYFVPFLCVLHIFMRTVSEKPSESDISRTVSLPKIAPGYWHIRFWTNPTIHSNKGALATHYMHLLEMLRFLQSLKTTEIEVEGNIFYDGTLFFNSYNEDVRQTNHIRTTSVLMWYTAMLLKDILMRNHIIMSEEIESSLC